MSGQTLTFAADVQPANATNRNVVWSVISASDGGTGTIDANGVFTAGNPGQVRIQATATDGSGVCGYRDIFITPVPVTSVTINQASPQTLNTTSTLNLTATVEPSNATNKNITWSIHSFTPGLFTPDASAGTLDVTLDASTGELRGSDDCTVVVRATSQSDNTKYGEITVNIKSGIEYSEITGVSGHKYTIACYPDHGGCWQWGSIEGHMTAHLYDEPSAPGVYTETDAGSGCLPGFNLAISSDYGTGYNAIKDISRVNRKLFESPTPVFPVLFDNNVDWSTTICLGGYWELIPCGSRQDVANIVCLKPN
jgi:hypothetical protein